MLLFKGYANITYQILSLFAFLSKLHILIGKGSCCLVHDQSILMPLSKSYIYIYIYLASIRIGGNTRSALKIMKYRRNMKKP